MKMRLFLIAACLAAAAVPAAAQGPYDPAARIAAQRDGDGAARLSRRRLARPGLELTPQGRREMIQAERIGPFLDGSVRVMEGRGYTADGIGRASTRSASSPSIPAPAATA